MRVPGKRARASLSHRLAKTLPCAIAALALSAPAVAAAADNQGQHVFMESDCFVCHGQFGAGGVGRQLRGDRFLAITDYVIAQILIGRGILPPFADRLNNDQIAAVATYIRSSWGNSFGAVTPNSVKQVRQMIASLPAPADGKFSQPALSSQVR